MLDAGCNEVEIPSSAGLFRISQIVKSKNIQYPRPVEDPGFCTGYPVSANAGKGFRRNDLDEKRDFMQLEDLLSS